MAAQVFARVVRVDAIGHPANGWSDTSRPPPLRSAVAGRSSDRSFGDRRRPNGHAPATRNAQKFAHGYTLPAAARLDPVACYRSGRSQVWTCDQATRRGASRGLVRRPATRVQRQYCPKFRNKRLKYWIRGFPDQSVLELRYRKAPMLPVHGPQALPAAMRATSSSYRIYSSSRCGGSNSVW
jgi:hypothetical protein